MNTDFDFLRLAAGLGLFLFGMRELEVALAGLAGRPFKQFLKTSTRSALRGVTAGAAATAALQSSSVVSLIVLAFVGSGLINLPGALAIVFGSNVGTTITGWIVATVGFRLDIEELALPLVALGGLTVVWSQSGTRVRLTGLLLAGFGLMLLGLDFMKTGSEAASALFDPGALAGYPLLVFVAAGILITAIIQSSSATIMMALSAIYVGAIELDAAAAIAIGADLGTTVTAVLGALAGSTDKKRVALAIVLFNVVTNVIALIFIRPLLSFVQGTLGIGDPLLALVAFHTLFNTLGVLLFMPAIPALSRWLSRRFVDDDVSLTRHIKPGVMAVPEVAAENVARETLRLIDQAAAINLAYFHLPPDHRFYDAATDRDGVRIFASRPDVDEAYSALKELEGLTLAYTVALSSKPLEAEESTRLGRLVPAMRNAVHSSKCMRDIDHDLRRFRDSINDRFNAYLAQFRESVREFYDAASSLDASNTMQLRFENLATLRNTARELHQRLHQRIYREIESGDLSRDEISTLFNVNREIYASNKAIVAALGDTLLDEESARNLESLPESA